MRLPSRPPPSLYSNFFSSLKQVEKRLKLENTPIREPFNFSQPPQPPSPPEDLETRSTSSTESLSSPIYLHVDQEQSNYSTALQESSEAPLAFFSSSSQSLPIHQETQQVQPKINEAESDGLVDDIHLLMQLLGLSDNQRGRKREEVEELEEEKERVCGGDCCGCEGGFYDKIVEVKGLKCKKELDRLKGWISYFLQNNGSDGGGGGGGGGGRSEPLRLAFLLLGKAAFDMEISDNGLEFPSTIEEFLKHDPPSE